MKGNTAIKISCNEISAGATDFSQKQAGPKGGDKKYICIFITNRTPNHTAAHSGSKPSSGAIPTTTGAKTGTVIKAIAIHSINVPKITRIPIMTKTIPIAGRPNPENSDLIKSAPPIRL